MQSAARTPAQSHVRIQEFVTLGIIPVTWGIGTLLCRPLGKHLQFLGGDTYSDNSGTFQASVIGLLREYYLWIQLVLLLAVLLLICRAMLSYLRTLFDDERSLSAMQLRLELWKWNGKEQRLASRKTPRMKLDR